MAVLGRYAAATGWSSSEEERQKALFSYLVGGVPLIVWDNIKKGTNVSSEAVDRSLTSPDYQLRILGKSQGSQGERERHSMLDRQRHRPERRSGQAMLRRHAPRLAGRSREQDVQAPEPGRLEPRQPGQDPVGAVHAPVPAAPARRPGSPPGSRTGGRWSASQSRWSQASASTT